MLKSRLLAFVLKELREIWPPTLFFAISFNILVLTTQLILSDYLIHLWNFMLATTAALVVGKSVLVANALPFFRRFDRPPLIRPVLYKTVIYWAVVFLVRFLEQLIEYVSRGGKLKAIPEYVSTHFIWDRFVAIQIWIFLLFLVYTSVAELNAWFGHGTLMKIYFTPDSSEMKPISQAADSRGPRAQPDN